MFHRPYILFCPHTLTNYGYVGRDAIDNARFEVLEAIRLLPKERFILKMHPSHDDSQFYREWKDVKDIHNCKVVWRENTTRLIKGAKLVIVQHSSVALEAKDFKKPIIIVEDEVSDVLGEFDEFSMLVKVRTKEEIVRIIEAHS